MHKSVAAVHHGHQFRYTAWRSTIDRAFAANRAVGRIVSGVTPMDGERSNIIRLSKASDTKKGKR